MKKYFILILAVLAVGCAKNDITPLLERMSAVEERISTLQEMLDIMNQDASALKNIVDAFSKGTTVENIEPQYSDDVLTGYKVTLSDGSSFVIHNGVDGKDGYCGADGQEGHTPVIGVVLVNGRYYWTVDGEMLKDESGNAIPASPDPSESQAKDGQTPVISIEDGKWMVTVGGRSYVVGTLTDTDRVVVDGVFSSVTQTDQEVTFTLGDGSVISLPKASSYSVELSSDGTYRLQYTVKGSTAGNTVDVICEKGWSVSVTPTTKTDGIIIITPDEGPLDAAFMVLCSDGEHNAMASFSIVNGIILL